MKSSQVDGKSINSTCSEARSTRLRSRSSRRFFDRLDLAKIRSTRSINTIDYGVAYRPPQGPFRLAAPPPPPAVAGSAGPSLRHWQYVGPHHTPGELMRKSYTSNTTLPQIEGPLIVKFFAPLSFYPHFNYSI